MSGPIVMLSMVTSGDADGFDDAWFDAAEVDAPLHEPAVAFNAIVLSLLETDLTAVSVPQPDESEIPLLAAA